MELSEFKYWLQNCIKDARAKGLTDEEILIGFLEQTGFLIVEEQLKLHRRVKHEIRKNRNASCS